MLLARVVIVEAASTRFKYIFATRNITFGRSGYLPPYEIVRMVPNV